MTMGTTEAKVRKNLRMQKFAASLLPVVVVLFGLGWHWQ